MKGILIGSYAVTDLQQYMPSRDADIVIEPGNRKAFTSMSNCKSYWKDTTGTIPDSTIHDIREENFHIEAIHPANDHWMSMLFDREYSQDQKLTGFLTFNNLIDLYHVSAIDELLITKAHLILNYKWERHMFKYHKLKQICGLTEIAIDDIAIRTINPDFYPIYVLARQNAIQRGKKTPNLNTSKNKFFNDLVPMIYDHDSIHRAISYPSEPAYVSMLDGEVKVSKSKWHSMSFSEKIRCVIEEASILAIERSIIPSMFIRDFRKRSETWSYQLALKKICTTITSGWFRDFAIEVYPIALRCKPNLNSLLRQGIDKGIIIPGKDFETIRTQNIYPQQYTS